MKTIFLFFKELLLKFFLLIVVFLCFCYRENNVRRLNNTESDYGPWINNIVKYIIESEYEIKWQESCREYQSPNRRHNLRFSYYLEGFKVKPMDNDEWSLKIFLKEFGREEKEEYRGREILINKNRGYVKGNFIDISYENNNEGMREDFILYKKPKGKGRLILEFEVKIDKLKMMKNDYDISFVMDGKGEVLRYGNMEIYDNEGKELKGEFEIISENRFAILIDDKDAKYPIIIDPLSSTPDWIAEGNQTSAYFGYSVSTAGDVNGDGYSDVIIGAYMYDNGQTNEGRAYVYYGSPTGLSLTPNWIAEGNQTSALFGYSVSTAGDVNGDGYSDVIIGAYMYDNGQTNEGRAYVYYGSPTGLSLTPNWTAEINKADAHFGYSVSTAGDVNGDGYSDVIIGAPDYINSGVPCGALFAYYGSSSGLSQTYNWIKISPLANVYFGRSISTAGDVNGDGYSDVLVGVYAFSDYRGIATAYYGSPTGLSNNENWYAYSDQVYSYFGYSVSTAGDVNGDGYSDVIIGAPNYDNLGNDEGRVYLYYGSAIGLSQNPRWIASSKQGYSYFGNSVSTAGDVNGDGYSDVIIGAYMYDNGQTNEGTVFVFYGSSVGLSIVPDWLAEPNKDNSCFGYSVSTAGDVNGDGYSDVIIGAPYYDNVENDEGRAFVYYGSGETGIQEKIDNEIGLYYTITKDGIIFHIEGVNDGEIIISNILGIIVDRIKITRKEVLWDKGVPNGVYFARIEIKNKNSEFIKIFIFR